MHALTISTLPNDKFGSSAKSLEPDARLYRKRGDFVSWLRSVIDRLNTAAIGLAWTVVLIAGSIMAVLCALDLMDMLRW